MSHTAWNSIEYDSSSRVATVVVDDEHLKDFPGFMRRILHEKIGEDVGFFKIRFSEGVNFKTSLEEITSIIKTYYRSPQMSKRKRGPNVRTAEISIQAFFRGNDHREWFGYADIGKLGANAKDPFVTDAKAKFVNSISNRYLRGTTTHLC